MTGVHEGGAGGITGSNDLVSAISGQPSGPAGGVSCTPWFSHPVLIAIVLLQSQ